MAKLSELIDAMKIPGILHARDPYHFPLLNPVLKANLELLLQIWREPCPIHPLYCRIVGLFESPICE